MRRSPLPSPTSTLGDTPLAPAAGPNPCSAADCTYFARGVRIGGWSLLGLGIGSVVAATLVPKHPMLVGGIGLFLGIRQGIMSDDAKCSLPSCKP